MVPDMEVNYKQGHVSDRIQIELADYQNTHVTLNAVDAVISPLSTILLEAAMHGKPIAAYLPDEDMKKNKFLFSMTNMSIFRDFFERVDCIRSEKPENLVDDCVRLLQKTDEPNISHKLMKQCEFFVEQSDCSYSVKLIAFIEQMLKKH
jgi:CDP-glycerol glycerophosphotransferase (TagB/SpsB family)